MTNKNTTPDRMTLDEAVEVLTGYDELFIRERFGDELEDLLENQPRHGTRAVAACVLIRESGCLPDAAYDQVMKLSMKELNEFFPESEPEAMPDEPDTAAGKDASADA